MPNYPHHPPPPRMVKGACLACDGDGAVGSANFIVNGEPHQPKSRPCALCNGSGFRMYPTTAKPDFTPSPQRSTRPNMAGDDLHSKVKW